MELIICLVLGCMVVVMITELLRIVVGIALVLGIGWCVGALYNYILAARVRHVAALCYVPYSTRNSMLMAITAGAWCAGIGAVLAPAVMIFGAAAYLAARVTFGIAGLIWRGRG